MAGAVKQFVVYSKVTFIVAIFAAVALVVFKNRGYKTRFWPGAAKAEVSTLWLMLATGVGSIVVFWMLSRLRRVWRQLAELRSEKARETELLAQARRREELDDQERRIDQKLKKALNEDNSQG